MIVYQDRTNTEDSVIWSTEIENDKGLAKWLGENAVENLSRGLPLTRIDYKIEKIK